jgi:hypothetical protein
MFNPEDKVLQSSEAGVLFTLNTPEHPRRCKSSDNVTIAI